MKDEEIKKIDAWLEGLSQESIAKIFTVSTSLRSISELTDTTLFNAPYEALEKANLDKTSISAILTELWRKGIIELMEHTEGNWVSDWNKGYEEDNFFNNDTMIQINRPVFEYFIQSLRKNKSKADTIKNVNHSDLASVILKGKKYKIVRKMAELLIENNTVDNYLLAQILTPTVLVNIGKRRKFTKKDYNSKKHNPLIKNRFITLRKFWKPLGYTVRQRGSYSELKKL